MSARIAKLADWPMPVQRAIDLIRPSLMIEPSGHCLYDGAVCVIVFESPNKCAAQATISTPIHVKHFDPHGQWVFVVPEGLGCWVVEPLRNSVAIEIAGIPVRRQSRKCGIGHDSSGKQRITSRDRPVGVRAQAGSVGKENRAYISGRLVQAVIRTGNTRPAIPIQPYSGMPITILRAGTCASR